MEQASCRYRPTQGETLNVTCDGRLPKRECPNPSPHLPSLADVRLNGQSTAHTKKELAYSLAQICSLNCVCAAPVFSTPPLCLTFSFFPLSAVISLSKCVFFLLFLHISLRSPSNHSVFIRRLLCELRGRLTGAGSLFGALCCRNKVVSLK